MDNKEEQEVSLKDIYKEVCRLSELPYKRSNNLIDNGDGTMKIVIPPSKWYKDNGPNP